MSRVSIASLPDGVVWQGNPFAPASGATAYVYAHAVPPAVPTQQVTVHTAETGTATLTQPITANAFGILPGYVDGGVDVDIIATYGGVSSAPTLQPVLRAGDLIGTDGLIGGPGSLGLTPPTTTYSIQTQWVSKGANYTMASTDSGVLATATLTVTLPVTPIVYCRYGVKVGTPGIVVTVSTGTSGQIDSGMGGPGTSEILTVLGMNQDYQLAPNGTDWLRV